MLELSQEPNQQSRRQQIHHKAADQVGAHVAPPLELVVQHGVRLTFHAGHVFGPQAFGICTLLRGGAPQCVHPFFQIEFGQMGQDVAVKRCVFLGLSMEVDRRKGEELPKEQDDTAQDGGEQ